MRSNFVLLAALVLGILAHAQEPKQQVCANGERGSSLTITVDGAPPPQVGFKVTVVPAAQQWGDSEGSGRLAAPGKALIFNGLCRGKYAIIIDSPPDCHYGLRKQIRLNGEGSRRLHFRLKPNRNAICE
jgi:hypothetical protein